MRILLLTPDLNVEKRYGKKLKDFGSMSFPPLGLAYIAAVLEKAKHTVKIIDCTLEELDYTNYDVIGITVMTPSYNEFRELVNRIESDVPLIAGGMHPSILPLDTLKENKKVDYIVCGEGENIIVNLIDAIQGKIKLKDVKGIAYREGDRIIVNPPAELIHELDTLPYPSRHLFKPKYIPAPSTYRNLPCAHMIISRGCPNRCIYCSVHTVSGRKYRHHSVRRVIDEINELDVKEIYFLDDLFTLDRRWVLELCASLESKNIEWSCNTRVNLVDIELLKAMKKAGCWQIHYGIESGSQRLLNLVKKGITLDQCRDAIKWSKKAKIQTRAYFMLGLPTETKEESMVTIEFAKKLNPDYAKFSLTTPYPGTEMYEILKDEIGDISWDKYRSMGGFVGEERPYVSKGRTSQELNELQKMAHKSFFLRPRVILNRLLKISSLTELRMNLKSMKMLVKL